MSVLADTFQTLARGVPTNRVGAVLGIDQGLADACIDHWVRLGMVTPSGSLTLGCTDCSARTERQREAKPALGSSGEPATDRPPSCFGCPFTR